MKTVSIISWTLLLVGTYVNTESIHFEECDEDPSTKCTVHDVRIQPCPEAASDRPCKVKTGTAASIEFDFTPDVDASELENKAYYVQSLMNLPYVDLNSEGCLNTQCPIKAGRRQSFAYNLEIPTKYFKKREQSFPLKWQLTSANGLSCNMCFTITIAK